MGPAGIFMDFRCFGRFRLDLVGLNRLFMGFRAVLVGFRCFSRVSAGFRGLVYRVERRCMPKVSLEGSGPSGNTSLGLQYSGYVVKLYR